MATKKAKEDAKAKQAETLVCYLQLYCVVWVGSGTEESPRSVCGWDNWWE